jgi:hypothetical protein
MCYIEEDIMIYGYGDKVLNEYGLLELREVTFAASPDTLREIASFLTSMADLLEAGTFRITHRHIGSVVSDWGKRFPGKDVIVIPPPEDEKTAM